MPPSEVAHITARATTPCIWRLPARALPASAAAAQTVAVRKLGATLVKTLEKLALTRREANTWPIALIPNSTTLMAMLTASRPPRAVAKSRPR